MIDNDRNDLDVCIFSPSLFRSAWTQCVTVSCERPLILSVSLQRAGPWNHQEWCLKDSSTLECARTTDLSHGHKLEPWKRPRQSSHFVMWVHSRKRPTSTSPPSPSFTPWSGTNATPLPAFPCGRSALTRTEMVLQGLDWARWAWMPLYRSVATCVSLAWGMCITVYSSHAVLPLGMWSPVGQINDSAFKNKSHLHAHYLGF